MNATREHFAQLIIDCANHRINYHAHETIIDNIFSSLNEREFTICEFMNNVFDAIDELRAINYYIDAMNMMR